jgi:hypothetical protein
MTYSLTFPNWYWPYLASVCVIQLLSSIVKIKVCLGIVSMRCRENANDEPRNDLLIEHGVVLVPIIGIVSLGFLVNVFILGKWWWDWVMVIYFLFPWWQVMTTAIVGVRNKFAFWYQPMFWIPTMVSAYFIKGYDDNFMNLKPSPIVKNFFFINFRSTRLLYQALCYLGF